MRQMWGTVLSPLTSNEFERNAKEWTRENCAKQYPKRRQHPADHFFPEEGWGGRCGNNEITCHLSGYGKAGKVTFDWKHFTWEDYDEWLFGEEGLWKRNATERTFPDILVVHVGLHTCVHSWSHFATNHSMIQKHERDLNILMKRIREAIERTPSKFPRTQVIYQAPGRGGVTDAREDACSRHFNRVAVKEAHVQGFPVFEREEIERRLLFKSEYYTEHRTIKNNLHLDGPGPNIVATSLLALISCLSRNSSEYLKEIRAPDIS